MSLPVRLDAKAERDFDEALLWYGERNTVAGVQLAQAVNAALAEIGEYPDRWPFEFADIRVCPVPGWSYAIYYRVGTNRIRVIAVFHTSRDPQEWMDRI